jgi:TP901 family phage tail tape measure protein
MATTQRTNIWIDGSQAGATLTELKKKVSILNKEIAQLPRNSDAYKNKMNELKQASGALSAHRNEIKGINDSYTHANKGLRGMISQFAPMAGGLAIAGAAIGGIVAGISSWYNNNKMMEKSLSSLQALTGASTEDLKFYKKEAIEIGKTSTMSASQIVEAYKLVGSARPELLANKEALSAVTKEAVVLAEAAEMELGGSAKALTGIMAQFNLSADHSNRIINVLAAGSKEGAAEISDLSETIDKSGSVLNGYNASVEESVALAELLAEKNLKGSEAGNQLKNVMLSMQGIEALPAEALKQLEKYDVDVKKVANSQLPMNERIKELSKISGDATAMMKVFGRENIVAGKTILESSQLVDGQSSKFQKLTDAVTGTNTAYEQQRINNDNLDGDLKSLDSAWEGLTLSMSGGTEIFRGVVQVGTDVLNWTSDLITAFKEADTMALETQFLKLTDAFTFGIGPLHDYLEEAIRVNEITMDIVDSVKGQVEENSILVGSLEKNNKALKDTNITTEEKVRLETENEGIISMLNEKYPDLTANMDLHNLSTKDAIKLQKAMNDTLLEQAVASATAAESQRILGVIVEQTMKVQMLSAEIRKAKSGNVLDDLMIAKKAYELLDAKEELASANKQLLTLGKTMSHVKENLKGIDFSFGSKFKIQADIMSNAEAELKRMEKLLAKTTDPKQRQLIEANMKGLRASMKHASKDNQASLDALLAKTQEVSTLIVEDDKTKTKNLQGNAKKHIDEMKKLQEELTKVILEADKLQNDLDYAKKLENFTDAQDEEIYILQQKIEEKYQKEIDAARKLMGEKGDIGLKATEQFHRLIALEDEEYEHEKSKIQEKYRKEKQEKDYEIEKQKNLQFLEQERTLQDAIVDLKVTKAKAALAAIHAGDITGHRLAKEELEKALKEQAELEKQRKLEALMDLQSEMIISDEEFKLRKEELEIEHQQKIVDINKETSSELEKIDTERLERTAENMNKILEISNSISSSISRHQLKEAKKEHKAHQKMLDEKLEKGIITEAQYREEKDKMDKEFAMKKYEIELKEFKKNQMFATADTIIATALAVIKSAPNPVTMALSAATGVASLLKIATAEPPEAPQFKDGGYTTVTGASDGLRYRAKRIGKLRGGMTPGRASLALVGEEGPEFVVPAPLLKNTRVARHVAMIEAIRTNQFADGGYTSAPGAIGGGDELLDAVNTLNRTNQALLQVLPNLGITFSDEKIVDLEKNQKRVDKLKS